MTAADVEELVRRVLVDEFELEPDDLRPDARLGEDLALDSLDRVDLIVTLEKEIGARFGEDQVKGVRTVADLVASVAQISAAAG